MLQTCLNGGLARAECSTVPVTLSELAVAAKEAFDAGAQEFHIHPRGPSGRESLAGADVAAALLAVRAAVPGAPVGVGTGAWIAPCGRARHALIEAWTELPDYASVNLNEEDAPAVMDLLTSKGIGIEAGIWTIEDAQLFVTLPQRANCLRVLVEMTSGDPGEAESTYRTVRKILADAEVDLPILLHGEGGSAWPMIELAAAEGHDTRVGFEDVQVLPNAKRAVSNAELVRAALTLSSVSRTATASCLCGAVRIAISAPPILTLACHCRDCQKLSASAYSLTAIVPADAFAISKGHPVIGGRKTSSRHHHFCPSCMTWLFARIDGAEERVNVRSSILDRPEWSVPYVEVMTDEKLDWATTPAVRSFARFPSAEEFRTLANDYADRRPLLYSGPQA